MNLRTLPGIRVLHHRVVRTVLIIALLMYAALGIFTPMEADDFCQAVDAHTYGVLGSPVHTYETWQGRFSQMTISSALYVAFGNVAPGVSAALIVIATGIVAVLVWGEAGLLLSIAFLLALQNNIWQGLFWMPGGITYAVPLILAIVLSYLASKRVSPLVLFGLALVIAGFNETIGLLLIGAAVLYRQKAIGLGALLGAAILFAAPGNVIRNSFLPHIDMILTGTRTLSFLAQWGILLAITVPAALAGAFVAGMQRPARLDWRLVLVLLAMLFSLAATVNLAGGATDRAWVAPTVGLIGLCFHVGQVYGQREQLSRQLRGMVVIFVMLGMITFVRLNLFSLALAPVSRSQTFAKLADIDTTQGWIAPCQQQLQSLTTS